MTVQAGEILHENGKWVWMQTWPLEAYWDAHPPRPYMIPESSAESRGYIGEWELSDRGLYLKKFEATAYKTSNDWVGDERLMDLWLRAGLHSGSVAQVITKLTNLPATANAARARAARIVKALAEKLLTPGTLTPDANEDDLHRAAVEASSACFTNERYPISVATLFPDATNGVFAAWFTGTLSIDEGELLGYQDFAPFFSIYEFTRLIEIRDGCLVNEERKKNEAPPPDESRTI